MKIRFSIILLCLSCFELLAQGPSVGGCPVFPADNIWNTRIEQLPVDANSSAYIASEGSTAVLHPDFGTVYNGAPIGIPFVVVPASQPLVPIVFMAYGSESDPGPYPVPATAPIEGGASSTGDRHVLAVQSGSCGLYEMFSSYPQADGSWQADSGSVFSLNSNAPLRPAGWTSADAAGLPIFPGLVRYDEVQAALSGDGVIHHALRFTVPYTRAAYVWPARHLASSSTNLAYPPMGLRFRLKAGTNIQVYPGTSTAVSAINQVILRTLQEYGMFVADNGSSFFVSGAPDSRWNDSDLHLLTSYHASDFEAVDESALVVNANSGQALQPISLVAPNGPTVAGSVTVTAQTGPYAAFSFVQFLLDGSALGSAVSGSGPAYSKAWDTTTVANGAHTLSVVATEPSGLTVTVAIPVSVTVNNAPAVPAGLQATMISSTQIGLTWPASTGLVPAAGYKVYRNGAVVGSPVNASFVDVRLNSRTTYTYSVAAVNAGGVVSAPSAAIQVTTKNSVLPPWFPIFP